MAARCACSARASARSRRSSSASATRRSRSRSARSCGATTRPATCSARPCSQAADRGAQVIIHKDRIAAVYEYTGGNKQSFFHKRVDPIRGFQAWFLGAVYRAPGSFKQKPNALAQRDPRAPEHHRRAHAQALRSLEALHHRRSHPRARLDGHRRQPPPRVDRRHGRGRRRGARRAPARAHGRPRRVRSVARPRLPRRTAARRTARRAAR